MFRIFTAVLIFLTSASYAEDVYVIDRLLIGVHKSIDPNSPLLKVIPTGTRLEILKTEGDYAQIKGPEKLKGWVDAGYLSTDKPAQLVLEGLNEENQSLRSRLEKMTETEQSESEESDPDSGITALQQKLETAEQELASERLKLAEMKAEVGRIKDSEEENPLLKSKIATLEQQNRTLESNLADTISQQSAERGNMSITDLMSHFSIWIILLVLTLAGFAGGIWLMDLLNRRRHGGFRI